ncbi:hypothetical protein ACFQMM_22395 [Saliphagus sp. GCM10025308]
MSVRSIPQPSSHAKLRFMQRTGIVEFSLRQAWQSGLPVDVDGQDYHQARYDELLDVVLLARDGVLTTVLNATHLEVTEGSR